MKLPISKAQFQYFSLTVFSVCILKLGLSSVPAWSTSPTSPSSDVSLHNDRAIALDRHPELIANIELAQTSYVAQEHIPISAAWKLVGISDDHRIWEVPLPIRTRSLFYHRPPPGMKILQRTQSDQDWTEAESLPFMNRIKDRNSSWNFGAKSLRVNRPAHLGAPNPWEYAVQYPTASKRERILADSNTTDPKAYALRQQQVNDETRHGVYLPAPTTIEYVLTIPENGLFKADVCILPPEAADPILSSDGAEFKVDIIQDGQSKSHLYLSLSDTEYHSVDLDLSAFANEEVTLRLSSVPIGSSELDYVFVADPIIYTPSSAPKRILWVFIDTLRQDHLGMYGYDRDTTPKLDAWAQKNAAIYTQGRSIAPWTLPSSRSMVTGNVPEKWGAVPTIQKQLAENGWYTSFLVGNIYLSSNFEGQTDWSSHRCINWPLADVQVQRAKEVFQKYHDRDVFMMLHFMDMHLPYTEPPSYRKTFAGKRPNVFQSDEFSRSDVLKAKRTLGEDGQQYVIDRYDNNLRYLDDVLTPLLEELPDDTVIAIFSDHGEEFWDHNSFEHGHTLYDELLKIPFILKAPGIKKGIHEEPVSLLDLAPTTAKAAGISIAPTQGWALQDHQNTEIQQRPQAFGRLLYGDDAWGSLHDNLKYTSQSGEEALFDLTKDPLEMHSLNLDSTPKGRQSLQDALDREVRTGYRIELSKPRKDAKEVSVIVEIPSGVQRAWPASDPTGRQPMDVDFTEDIAVFTWFENGMGNREAFVMPKADSIEALSSATFTLLLDEERYPLESLHVDFPEYDGHEIKLFQMAQGSYKVTISYMVTPIPSQEDLELNAFDDEVSEELKVLGYME